METESLEKLLIENLRNAVSNSHPKTLLPKFIEKKSEHIYQFGEEIYDINHKDLYVIGFGKAGATMSEVAEQIFDDGIIKDGLVICPQTTSNLKSIKLMHSSHPFVSDLSFNAAKKMIDFIDCIPDQSIVLCFVSGGGSALLALPEIGISPKQKIDFFQYLLFQGLSEIEQNIVRKSISLIKGGKLAQKLKNKKLVNFVIMDNPYDYKALASGPTFIPDDKKTGKEILIENNLYNQIPNNIKQVIEKSSSSEFDSSNLNIQDIIVGGPSVPKLSLFNSLSKICEKVWLIKESFYYCDINFAKSEFSEFCLKKYNNAGESGLFAVVANGEIAVKVEKDGKGGRNQHFAALMIDEFKEIPNFVFASYATDGCDYIEGVHGAIISNITLERIKSKNIDTNYYIDSYNTYHLHEQLSTLIKGPKSGTNCSDVYVFIFYK
jgi:glycerate 2-kinase